MFILWLLDENFWLFYLFDSFILLMQHWLRELTSCQQYKENWIKGVIIRRQQKESFKRQRYCLQLIQQETSHTNHLFRLAPSIYWPTFHITKIQRTVSFLCFGEFYKLPTSINGLIYKGFTLFKNSIFQWVSSKISLNYEN